MIPWNPNANDWNGIRSILEGATTPYTALDLTTNQKKIILRQIMWLSDAMSGVDSHIQGMNKFLDNQRTVFSALRKLAEEVPFAEDHPQVSQMLRLLREWT